MGKRGPKKSPVNQQMRDLLDTKCMEEAEEIVAAIIKAAKGGCIQSAQMILNRIYPSRRGALISFEYFAVRSAADIPDAYAHYAGLAATGKITSDEMDKLTALVDRQVRAFELIEQQKKLDEMAEQFAELQAITLPKVA